MPCHKLFYPFFVSLQEGAKKKAPGYHDEKSETAPWAEIGYPPTPTHVAVAAFQRFNAINMHCYNILKPYQGLFALRRPKIGSRQWARTGLTWQQQHR
jgi:hypothetical protein